MTTEELNTMSDALMGPVLAKMAPAERKKLLLVLRNLVHPGACPWIDAQLAVLSETKNAAQSKLLGPRRRPRKQKFMSQDRAEKTAQGGC